MVLWYYSIIPRFRAVLQITRKQKRTSIAARPTIIVAGITPGPVSPCSQFVVRAIRRASEPRPRGQGRQSRSVRCASYLKFCSANFQFTMFQNASTYLGRALR